MSSESGRQIARRCKPARRKSYMRVATNAASSHADFAWVRLAVRDASIRNPPSEFRLLLIFHAYL
jgi:hypothetical protein